LIRWPLFFEAPHDAAFAATILPRLSRHILQRTPPISPMPPTFRHDFAWPLLPLPGFHFTISGCHYFSLSFRRRFITLIYADYASYARLLALLRH